MEIKINREIRNYTETMFFGLSLRQFVFSLAAVLVAVGIYFLFKPYFGTETVSWLCIVGAAPFAALGLGANIFANSQRSNISKWTGSIRLCPMA